MKLLAPCFALLVLCLAPEATFAQKRKLLAERNLSTQLKAIVEKIQSENESIVPYDKLSPHTKYFARITKRKYLLDDKLQIKDSGWLGGTPFVFFTTPEGLYGKTLSQILLEIGFEAEDIVRQTLNNNQRADEDVVILFRFPKSIQRWEGRDGKLPAQWKQHFYVPTWQNEFSLFGRLAGEANIRKAPPGSFAPEKTFFHSEQEKQFAISYPSSGKKRIQSTPYAHLKATGGADWQWRRLLEDKLNLSEHFRGTGRTWNEVLDPDNTKPHAGLFEFVGPNVRIKELPEFAIVDLGSLNVRAQFDSSRSPEKK